MKKLPRLGLQKGWRLEPSSQLPDVGAFETCATPFNCVFYVGGADGRLMHQSPFLQIPGVDLNTWCVDILHTWHYGPLSTYITVTLQEILKTPVYQPTLEGLDKAEMDKLALLSLRSDMWMFYKKKREDPEWRKRGSEVHLKTLSKPETKP